METKPDTIRISASHLDEVPATHADVFVTIKGSSLVSGGEALKKAKEVKEMVEALTGAGLPAEDIRLQSIHTENTGGPLLKSSSATYRLRLRCNELEKIPDLLGAITAQKNATFERVDWKYPDEEAREKGMEQALQKAHARAGKVAAQLGVKLLGIYHFEDGVSDDEAPPGRPLAMQAATRAVGVVPRPADLGMDIQHSKNVRYHVDIEYRVSGFDAKEGKG
jgi:uncharacterized protein YggE